MRASATEASRPIGREAVDPIRLAIFLIAGLGWIVRAMPLMRSGGAWVHDVDYDEGVYFASAALLFRAVLPYRDFVFVHPPGLLYALAPTAWLSRWIDPASAFAAARWFATGIGAINIALMGRLTQRIAGPVAGLTAAALYATQPDVVIVERGPFLEPMLNLACLMAATAWLGAGRRPRDTAQVVVTGALLGLAASIKLWGGIWLIGCMASMSPTRRLREGLALVTSMGVAALILIGPLAAVSPLSFFRDVVAFHSWRPPDGVVPNLERLTSIFGGSSRWPTSVLAIGGLILALRGAIFGKPGRKGEQQLSSPGHSGTQGQADGERSFAATYLLIISGFLLSATYWTQYNSHLALPSSALAAFGAGALWRWARPRAAYLAATAAVLLTVVVLDARRAWLAGRARSPELVQLGDYLRSAVPPGTCLVSFEPAWTLAAGRLPTQLPGLQLPVDPYALMLIDALQRGARFDSTAAAFQDDTTQRQMRQILASCRFVALGGRGHWQLSADSQRWLSNRFVQRFPAPGSEGIDVWELR